MRRRGDASALITIKVVEIRMTRISTLTDEEMSEEQRSAFNAAVASGNPHAGPFRAYLRDPKLMQILQDMFTCLKESPLQLASDQLQL